jgi:hypothetical protein
LPASPYLPDRVSARIDEPGRQGKADVGDAVHGLEARLVVLGSLDAVRAQLGDLCQMKTWRAVIQASENATVGGWGRDQ